MDFITLGHNCQISQELIKRGHFPLELTHDIGFKHIRGIISILESNCQDFFNWDNLEVIGDHEAENTILIEDIKTGVFDIHNFHISKSLEENYKLFNDKKKTLKYAFLESLKHKEFLQITRTNRHPEKIEEIVRLHDVINKIRDGKKFDLYVFQDSKFMRRNWGVRNLHTFEHEQWKWDGKWVGESDVWRRFSVIFENNIQGKVAPKLFL